MYEDIHISSYPSRQAQNKTLKKNPKRQFCQKCRYKQMAAIHKDGHVYTKK